MTNTHRAVALAGTVTLVVLACQPARSASSVGRIRSAGSEPAFAQVYYWRAKPGMLNEYTRYIREVAEPIDEDARLHGAFISVTTLQSRDTLAPFTHMRVFLVRDSTQLANLGAELNAAGARLEPDSVKRRARSTYGATLRDAAGSAIFDVVR